MEKISVQCCRCCPCCQCTCWSSATGWTRATPPSSHPRWISIISMYIIYIFYNIYNSTSRSCTATARSSPWTWTSSPGLVSYPHCALCIGDPSWLNNVLQRNSLSWLRRWRIGDRMSGFWVDAWCCVSAEHGLAKLICVEIVEQQLLNLLLGWHHRQGVKCAVDNLRSSVLKLCVLCQMWKSAQIFCYRPPSIQAPILSEEEECLLLVNYLCILSAVNCQYLHLN